MDHERSFLHYHTHSLLGLPFAATPRSFLVLCFFTTANGLDEQWIGWRSFIFLVYMYGVQMGLIDSMNTLHSRIHCVCEDGLYIHVLFLHCIREGWECVAWLCDVG